MVYEEICSSFLEELEDRIGHGIDDVEYVRLCTSIVDEMCAKPRGTTRQVGINTRFGEWFVDSMPKTFNLMCSHLWDAIDGFIEQKIDEKYGKEGE